MLEFVVLMVGFVALAAAAVRYGVDSRDLNKSLNSFGPVRPQL